MTIMANSIAPAAQAQARPKTKTKTILLIEDEEAHVEPLDDIMLLLDTNFSIERVKSIRLLKNSLGKEQRGSNRGKNVIRAFTGKLCPLPVFGVWVHVKGERNE